MPAPQARYILGSLFLVGLLALPARAEIQSVTFTTTNKLVAFLWGTAISNVLRSQDGIEEVEAPYENLRKHLSLKVKTRKDQAPDVAALSGLLEQEVGFAPITEVKLELRGRLVRRDGARFLEVSETGPTFRVEKIEGDTSPPENRLIAVTAGLVDIRAVDRIVLVEWKDGEEPKP